MWHPEQSPCETALRAVVVYTFVHVAFRLVGRRSLGQHSTYAIVLFFLIAVPLREAIVTDDRSLATALVGFATLMVLDGVVARLTMLSATAAAIVEGPVRVLVRDGCPDEEEMRRAHVSHDQLLAAVREHGREALADVHRAYLERTGRISVVFAAGLTTTAARGP